MFMGPFEQAIAWDKRGILGTVRFLEKVWNIAQMNVDKDVAGTAVGKTTDKELLALLHKTIKKVSADIEAMAFNTAISSLMVFINKCDEYRSIDSKTVWAPFLQLLAPFAPHIAEELWVKIGNKKSIHTSGWPVADEQLLVEDTFELIIQVNGKMRDKVSAPIDLAQADAENLALGRDEVKKWASGTPKKVIFVKNRLINFIV
jgi:leucyl-tRNA synthetase